MRHTNQSVEEVASELADIAHYIRTGDKVGYAKAKATERQTIVLKEIDNRPKEPEGESGLKIED